ncbi:MAG: hypothetical protein SGPRY_015009 [Prymnesium sp.]
MREKHTPFPKAAAIAASRADSLTVAMCALNAIVDMGGEEAGVVPAAVREALADVKGMPAEPKLVARMRSWLIAHPWELSKSRSAKTAIISATQLVPHASHDSELEAQLNHQDLQAWSALRQSLVSGTWKTII